VSLSHAQKSILALLWESCAMRTLGQFLAALGKRWWALLSTAAFTIIGLYALITGKSNQWVVTVSLAVAAIFFLIASFGAWKEQYDLRVAAESVNGDSAKKQKELKIRVGAAMKQGADIYDSFVSTLNGRDFSEVDRKADEWIKQTYAMLNEAEEPSDAESFSQVRHIVLSREHVASFMHLPEWKRERVAAFSLYRHALNHIKETKRL
jgi:hypothetical protein